MAKYVPLEITDEKLAELDAEHDDVFVFRGKPKAPWLAVVRRPNFQESQAYKAMASDPAKKPLANVRLIQSICVYPKGGTSSTPGPEWKAQLDRWPFFPDGLADSDDFKEFVGLSIQDSEK